MSRPPVPTDPQHPFTHLDAQGRARMVDVGDKPAVLRIATAGGEFVAAPSTLDRLLAGDLPKGEALSVARVAGILAAKRCHDLIPLCHSLPLDAVSVDFERSAADRLRIIATARITARTGVEMEALTAVTIAALTIWDMVKGVDKDLRIDGITLVSKHKIDSGHVSGHDWGHDAESAAHGGNSA